MLDPYSKRLLATDIILPILATTAASLRILARKMRKMPLLWDDWFIIAALFVVYGISANSIYASFTNVIGANFLTLSPHDFEIHEKVIYADVLLCHAAYGFIKLSVVCFYKRIFITPRFKIISNILVAVDVAWMITAVVGHTFSAWPISNWWVNGKRNMNYEAYLLSMTVLDFFIDVVTLCIPVPEILKLQMARKQKASLIAIFALGWFCVVASAIRLYYTNRLVLVFHGKLPANKVTSINVWNDVWAHIEAGVSIVTACLPTFAPLVKHVFSPESDSRWSLARLKQTFSIFSFGTTQRSTKEVSSRTNDSKRAWHELSPGAAVKSSAVGKGFSEDNIELLDNPNAIHVKQSFAQHDDK